MDLDLAQKAIDAALRCDWENALNLNKKLLSKDPKDIDALNRLARACAEVGKIKIARAYANKVLKIDPFNPIAIKSLEKWKKLKSANPSASEKTNAEAFLEEPGKTKIVSLIHLGDPKLLAELDAGDNVTIAPHSHRVSITTTQGKYIGRLADDLSARIRKLMKLGYRYQSLIKSVNSKEIKVIIREKERPEKLAGVASFPSDKINYVSFTPPELVHKKDEDSLEVEEE